MTKVIAKAFVRERDGIGGLGQQGESPDRKTTPQTPEPTPTDGGTPHDDGTKAFKLLVTRGEVDAAIAARTRPDRGTPRDASPIIRILAEGGDAVSYLAYRKSAGASVPDRWLKGIEELESLGKGFGAGNFRSIVIRAPTDGTDVRLTQMAESAVRATAGRKMETASATKKIPLAPPRGRSAER